MNTIPSVSIEQITPFVAQQMLDANTHNRPVSPKLVEVYAGAMARGEWDDHSQFVIGDNGVLLDGQHRAAAIVASGAIITAVVLRGVDPSFQETIDVGKKRTIGDVLALRGEKNARALGAAVSMFRSIEKGTIGRNQAATVKEVLAALEDHPEIRHHVLPPHHHTIVKLGVGLTPATVASLHYAFDLVDADDCEAFYESLATGANLPEGSPILALRKRLETAKTTKAARLRPKEGAALMIKAWNAYRSGESMKLCRWTPGGAKPESFPEVDGLAAALAMRSQLAGGDA
jgi:hypothetical protein